MTEEQPVFEDMTVLYELALVAGDSLNFVENCRRFTAKLQEYKQLAYCSVWVRDNYLSETGEENTLSRIFSTVIQTRTTQIPLEHSMYQRVAADSYIIYESDHIEAKRICELSGSTGHGFVLIALGNFGLMKLAVNGRVAEIFTDRELENLKPIFRKFAAILRGALAHGKLLREMGERKTAESELQQARNFLSRIIEAVGDPIFVTNSQHKIVMVNTAFSTLAGKESEQLVGLSGEDIFPEDVAREMRETDARVLATNAEQVVERQFTSVDGVTRFFSAKLSPFTDPIGQRYVVGVIRDVSDYKHLEFKQQKAVESARRASRIKSQFIANVSHELRTPLNVILGMGDLALADETEPARREMLAMIRESAGDLLRLINDILDFSKIEASKIEVEMQPFDLRELAESVVSSLGVQAYRKGLELSVFIDPEIPQTVNGDSLRLKQVLVNLLDNAIKFTEAGSVHLQITRTTCTQERPRLQCEVIDTGIGIEQAEIPRVFKSFYQSDSSSAKKFQGTGLGLPICSRLVKLMGGKLSVQSTIGSGSNFHFSLDMLPEDARPIQHSFGKLRGKNCLLVDCPQPTQSAKVVSQYLEYVGMEVCVAYGHSRAEELLSKESFQPDVVLLGLGAAKHLAEAGVGRPERFVVVVSPLALGTATKALKSIGCFQPILKPVRWNELLTAVANTVTGTHTSSEQIAAATSPEINRSLSVDVNILIVEDKLMNQRLLELMLQKKGWLSQSVSNGDDALSLIAQRQFDAILMDIQMPVMDGYEVTAEIRRLETRLGRRTPIIALTAHARPEDRAACIAAGMDDFLPKPINAPDLYAAIEKAVSTTSMSKEPLEMPPIEFSDNHILADKDLLTEVLTIFLEEAETDIENARAQIKNGNREELARSAHALKGELGNLSAWQGYREAKRLESMARHAEFSLLAEILNTLEAEIERIKQYRDSL
ncbi:MAG: response regulator [Firmicutes bacterium]|nr:response regulator [Bacillota bacterium]